MSSLPSNMSALILSYLHDDSRSYGDEMHDDIGGRYYSRALDSEQLMTREGGGMEVHYVIHHATDLCSRSEGGLNEQG